MKKNMKLWGLISFSIILFVVVLSGFLDGEKVLLSTDAVISNSNQSLTDISISTAYRVSSSPLIGTSSSSLLPAANTVLKGLFPSGILWNNWNYSLGCLLASFALIYWLRAKKIMGVASAIVLTSAFWVGSNFTLIYVGHAHKPFVVLFFVCSLIPAAYAAAGSIRAALIWGGCIGLMFSQQPDVAMFFALFGGSYLVFQMYQAQGFKPLKWLKVLVPALAVAFLFAGGPLLSGYKRHVKGSAQMQTPNKQAKWDYVTQWSFPPEEIIAFVAPGYTGWRSGEPEGPYWGRMGRSPGWEQTKQGFKNFKGENTYLGIIPIAFALFALFSCRRSKHRAEILFWGGAALVALLLSFGKFTPFYSLFYKLPVVNNIRNPNKFLQVFQICLAILTAYGFDALFRRSELGVRSSEKKDRTSNADSPKPFFWIMVGVLGLLVFWALSLTLGHGGDISRLTAEGWPQETAKIISQNKITALWHASFMAVVVTALFAVFSFPRFGRIAQFKNWIAAGLVLIVAVDAINLSKHYIKEMPRSYVEANALTNFLKENLGHERVALISQQGIYGIWTTYLLPYNKIPTFNYSDMPRMAKDYKEFLTVGQRNPLNMWRFSAVKYLLGPTAVEKKLVGQVRKVFAYDLAAGKKPGEFKVVSNPAGQHAVFELLNTYPRYAVTAPLEAIPDELALESVTHLPREQVGSAEVVSYRRGKVKLQVTAEESATLRIAEKWGAGWQAEVDGVSENVERIDFICQGVPMSSGSHEVVLKHASFKLFFYMQCAGYLILLVALVVTLIRRKEAHAAD